MIFLLALQALAWFAQPSLARPADTRWHTGECRDLGLVKGKNTCHYCHLNGIAQCNVTAYWDSCEDRPNPNPCQSDEMHTGDSRDYVTTFDTCKAVCGATDATCFSTTNTYQNQCCRCPKGWVPSVTPPTCNGRRASSIALQCVGCQGADEVLTGSDQKVWECQPKKKTPAPAPTCNRSVCGKDTWCPAHWVLKTSKTGKTSKLCQCTGGNCKDKDATCPKACLGQYAKPKSCPAVTCPKVKDKDKCYPSQEGIDLIKASENHCSTYYNVCDGVKTIGWGHNCKAHKDCDGLALPLAPCESERLLRCDLTELMQRVKRLPNYRRLSLNQFSALASLAFQYPKAFNEGRAIWNHMAVKSDADFDYRLVCDAILTATADHKPRRQKESQLCHKAPFTPMTC